MRISGHKTRSVFDRYNIVSERDLHEAARRLENYIEDRERDATAHNLGTIEADAEKPENQDAAKLLQ